jgi:hypothetical protein
MLEDHMSDIRETRNALERRILEGDGKAPSSERRAAFNNSSLAGAGTLIDKVAKHAYRVTADDIATAKISGLSEDQIFEIVICAAVGQATRQYEAGIAALQNATGRE